MCVKEFLGYNCGHCATPYLRQCPLTASNPTYPPCQFPAERPIFTNENCHPCSRVLWNQKVLADEEKHRKQHAMGECDCPVIFDVADRERRLRPRSGKGKGKNRELIQGEPSEAGRLEGKHLREDRHPLSTFGYEAHRTNDEPAGPRPYDHRGQNIRDSQQGWGSQNQNNTHHYEYTGYHFQGPSSVHSDIDHLASGLGIPQNGFVPEQYFPANTLMMDQPGCGMKWYPEQQSQLPVPQPYTSNPAPPTVPTIMASPPSTLPAQTVASTDFSLFTDYQTNFPRFLKHKAASEPAEFRYPPYSPSSESDRVLDEQEDVGVIGEDSPVVVSSSVVEDTIPM
ncbi:hypothetical protein VTL71DRAFT_3924 [Oculimacula yallundae]|uniref:Uncharacterized protein n=1 Tax=Oculimacula yallundae TaxID=86028 RepID=A0ABR4C4C8_9HELO